MKELADYEFNVSLSCLSVHRNRLLYNEVFGSIFIAFQVPDSFHGEDNGALHPLMLKWLVPEQQNR